MKDLTRNVKSLIGNESHLPKTNLFGRCWCEHFSFFLSDVDNLHSGMLQCFVLLARQPWGEPTCRLGQLCLLGPISHRLMPLAGLVWDSLHSASSCSTAAPFLHHQHHPYQAPHLYRKTGSLWYFLWSLFKKYRSDFSDFYINPVVRGFPDCGSVPQLRSMQRSDYLEYSKSLNIFLLLSLHISYARNKGFSLKTSWKVYLLEGRGHGGVLSMKLEKVCT